MLAADLAGYRIHHASSPFTNPHSAGVQSVSYLEGTTRHLLALPPGRHYLRVSAVDTSGNAGPPSELLSIDIAGSPPAGLELTLESSYSEIGGQLELQLAGAQLYDIDFDGDGVFELSDSGASVHQMTVTQAGIIRPRVRGHSPDGTAVALGGLSVVVSIANLPPFITLESEGSRTQPGVMLWFTARNSVDVDGSIVNHEWDFDGDGVFEFTSGPGSTVGRIWYEPGRIELGLRITDDDGASSTVEREITVQGGESQAVAECGQTLELYLMEADSHPAMAYINSIGNSVWFQRAADPFGAEWSQPLKVSLEAAQVNKGLALETVKGQPALVYFDEVTARTIYRRAVNPAGSAWGSGIIVENSGKGYHLDLAVIAGNPAVLMKGSLTGNLHYKRATDDTGGSWGSLSDLVIGETVYGRPSLLPVSGAPLALYTSEDAFTNISGVWANDFSGSSWDFPFTIGNPLLDNGENIDHVEHNGRHFISHTAGGNGEYELRVHSLGPGQDDISSARVAAQGYIGYYAMAIVGGRPAILYDDAGGSPNSLYYVHANDALGYSWGDPIQVASYDGFYASAMDLMEINGVVLFVFKQTDENLIYAGEIFE